jgi:excisionase family DNA binding protein
MDHTPSMPLSVTPFEQAGLHVQLDEFELLVMEAVARALPRRPLVDARADLTADEAAFLSDAGVSLEDFAPPELGARSPLVQTAADYAALLATALSVPELARRLGVDQSRVRQRIARHTLIAVKDGAAWRLPLFQLDDMGQQLVPGLATVAPRLAGVHPVAVARWFTLPHPDLADDEDRPISPRTWLLGGGDPTEVAALADELHERG